MTERIKEIAQRIRGLREMSGISAETLSRELDIPVEKYTTCQNAYNCLRKL